MADAARAAAKSRSSAPARANASPSASPRSAARQRNVSGQLAFLLPATGGGGDPFTDLLSAPLDTSMTFGAYLVGPSNKAAFNAARRLSMQPSAPNAPLFVFGVGGNGKSHLLQALAQRRRRLFKDETTLYASIETFAAFYFAARRSGDDPEFIERLLKVDTLVLDDVQSLARNPELEKPLRAPLEAFQAAGGRLASACSVAPSALSMDKRLGRALGLDHPVPLDMPEETLRRAALEKSLQKWRGGKRKRGIDAAALELLIREAPNDIRTQREILGRALFRAEQGKQTATVETIREELRILAQRAQRRRTLSRMLQQRRTAATP